MFSRTGGIGRGRPGARAANPLATLATLEGASEALVNTQARHQPQNVGLRVGLEAARLEKHLQ